MSSHSKIKFFNTLSGELETFHPLKKGEVSFYACGPTVYDYAHIGNFRSFVFEDLLRRFLEFKGFHVKHVMNITDVDDKTIAGAVHENKSLNEFTARYTDAFHEDLRTLNVLLPNHPEEQPRATREIDAMIDLIARLIERGHAYAQDGSVYYRVHSFKGYGKLSKKKLEMNIQGARVDVDEYEKEEASDFVLWKAWKEGEPYWESPWGRGRPGWHIECSAMSMKYLGETFDIHAGGEDLTFPHHENEIAQSEAATGKPFVKYWMHCKFLLVDGEKMSKSKGNFYTLRQLLEKNYDPMAVRYQLLATHYRIQLNFTLDGLKEAAEIVRKLDDCYYQCLSLKTLKGKSVEEATQLDWLAETMQEIVEGLEDDLNVSKSLAALSAGVRMINKALVGVDFDLKKVAEALLFFRKIDKLFGFDIAKERGLPDELCAMILDRHEVRANGDFKTDKNLQQKSDELRDEIQSQGWFLKDARPGQLSTVKRKRRQWDL